ncbi:hypothetical protein ACFSQT_11270 [Mesorhizobium calcicola]|uniref:Uncharacterized protein n=1 Tax=Mesorhizobium calcicola TaxID=1300310 RepID=A0ABW4WDH0_9HYPH
MKNDASSTIPEIVLVTDEDVPSDCALYAIILGGQRIGYIVVGPEGEELVTASLAEALEFVGRVTRTKGFGH